MKKKIKDLTLKEVGVFCKLQADYPNIDGCLSCPLNDNGKCKYATYIHLGEELVDFDLLTTK